jgi:hypothetical protein
MPTLPSSVEVESGAGSWVHLPQSRASFDLLKAPAFRSDVAAATKLFLKVKALLEWQVETIARTLVGENILLDAKPGKTEPTHCC